MDVADISAEIQAIRDRLASIGEERDELAEDDFSSRAALMDEEHRLEARLAELRDIAAEAGAGLAEKNAASQTDLSRTPKLPQS